MMNNHRAGDSVKVTIYRGKKKDGCNRLARRSAPASVRKEASSWELLALAFDLSAEFLRVLATVAAGTSGPCGLDREFPLENTGLWQLPCAPAYDCRPLDSAPAFLSDSCADVRALPLSLRAVLTFSIAERTFLWNLWTKHSLAVWKLARRCRRCITRGRFRSRVPEIGAAEEQICGGHMVFAGLGSPIGRATGTGLDHPFTADDLDRIELFYRQHNAPSQVDLTPMHDARDIRAVQGARLCDRRIE